MPAHGRDPREQHSLWCTLTILLLGIGFGLLAAILYVIGMEYNPRLYIAAYTGAGIATLLFFSSLLYSVAIRFCLPRLPMEDGDSQSVVYFDDAHLVEHDLLGSEVASRPHHDPPPSYAECETHLEAADFSPPPDYSESGQETPSDCQHQR